MQNKLLQTFLGIVFFLGGIILFYFFISGLSAGANFIFLGLSFVLIGIGIYFFVKTGKTQSSEDKKALIDADTSKTFSNKLAENNAMLNDWKKTNDTKERLRMLELSGSASEK
jgi:hypothetical protein